MNLSESSQTVQLELPPLIGQCSSCHTEILASHPYAHCGVCNVPLPYGINMQRRPIMYGTIKVTPASSAGQSTNPNDH
jgi:hypothetical protein